MRAMMITIANHLPNAWHDLGTCTLSSAIEPASLAQYAPVSFEMAPLVFQATAAPATFIPTQLAAGASHDRRRHGRFRPELSKRWALFRFGSLAPDLSLLGIALIHRQVGQTLEHVGAVVQPGYRQRTSLDRLRPCVLLGFGRGLRTQPVAVGQANVAQAKFGRRSINAA
jgi:hypothetical protein